MLDEIIQGIQNDSAILKLNEAEKFIPNVKQHVTVLLKAGQFLKFSSDELESISNGCGKSSFLTRLADQFGFIKSEYLQSGIKILSLTVNNSLKQKIKLLQFIGCVGIKEWNYGILWNVI